MSTILENSIWPNPDPEGPLGLEKREIPDGINTPWPDGDALIGNVVYKNGLISGFVDTKALILNESRTTTIPYDYVDIALDHSMENNLTINKGERCKYLKVKYIEFPLVLPPGYIELDYIETSGTQMIDMSYIIDTSTGIRGSWQQTAIYGGLAAGVVGSQDAETRFCPVYFSSGYYKGVFGYGKNFYFAPYLNNYMEPVEVLLNWLNDKRSVFYFDGTTAEGQDLAALEVRESNKITLCSGIYRHFGFQISQDSDIIFDFIPVLNADKEPGLWDKINNRFFGNTGTGTLGYKIKNSTITVKPVSSPEPKTFSLRDPYYVAPSGVYAQKIGENKIEILADTEETTGDNWEHFANTAEAYEHFGITPEEIEYQN